jgi:hypothetical protein
MLKRRIFRWFRKWLIGYKFVAGDNPFKSYIQLTSLRFRGTIVNVDGVHVGASLTNELEISFTMTVVENPKQLDLLSIRKQVYSVVLDILKHQTLNMIDVSDVG